MSSPIVYLLFGAPGSGKSTCLDYLANHTGHQLTIIPKESTRPRRATDGNEVISVQEISRRCDVRYSQYGYNYGFSSHWIWREFAAGHSAAVIVNDVRTLRLLKRRFGASVRCVYLHSNIDLKGLVALSRIRYPNGGDELDQDTKRRVEKITTIHRKYIENTPLFDYTLLNVGDFKKLHQQIDNILSDKTLAYRRLRSPVKIFVVAGAYFSGKEELVNAMQELERRHVVNYRKMTTRPQRPDDRGEMRHVERISSRFDVKYEKQGFGYGISKRELWTALAQGKTSLVVLSDAECIRELRKEFGSICTVLYLHANLEEEELRNHMSANGLDQKEADDRIRGIRELYDLYLSDTSLFDHVLLNTAEPEDLYDQAFNLLDYYYSFAV